MENKPSFDISEHYFNSLRDEILQTRSRIYRTLLAGIIGSPILTYFALQKETHILVILMAPFLVLMVLMLYISEQASMMQLGRFIKEKIESGEGDWEHWLSAKRAHTPEPQIFHTFAFLCLIFYVMLVCLAFQRFTQMKGASIPRGYDLFMFEFWRYGMPVLYVLATLWVFFTLIHFWRTALADLIGRYKRGGHASCLEMYRNGGRLLLCALGNK
ncbi:MAG: hypothetical protein R3C45_20230 [Phycisphaerales bacterium]